MGSSTRWVDGPWPLIETPSATRDITKHPAYYIANEMAFAHNAMLRGLNAIYLQAPHVPPNTRDATDFLFLIVSWSAWILHHHILEETTMFPGFESVEGVKPGALQENVEQHHAFSKGLQALRDYAAGASAESYSGENVVQLIDKFGDALRAHLADEIPTLLSLASVTEAHSKELLAAYKKSEKEGMKQDLFVVVPMVMGLSDKTFEGGNQWPKMPPGAGYIVNWVLTGRHARAWRFLPCDGWRTPRPLPFLGEGPKS